MTVRDKLPTVEGEDWLLIFLLAVFLIPFGYVYLNDQGFFGQETTADPELVDYCERTARDIEVNSSLAASNAQCDCMPPGTFDSAQYSVDERVENATELFLVQCDAPAFQEPLIFPIRRITEDASLNSTNGTTVPSNITGNQTQ